MFDGPAHGGKELLESNGECEVQDLLDSALGRVDDGGFVEGGVREHDDADAGDAEAFADEGDDQVEAVAVAEME